MKRSLPAAIVFILAAAVAQSQTFTVPQLINYQGKLTDIDGNPLETGNYVLEFNIYAVKSGGTPVWGPLIFDGGTSTGHGAKVPVVNGFFNVFLGPEDTSGRPIAQAFTEPTRYLGIKVNGGNELSPRQQILSSPYALQAQNADTVDGAQLSDLLTKGVYDTNDDGRVNKADHANEASHADNATQANNADTVDGKHASDILLKSTYDKNNDGKVDAAALDVPIGTILAWHKNFPGTPPLPSGWAECNGQVLHLAGSPYDGKTLPNLNGGLTSISGSGTKGRFLRGWNQSGLTEGDQSNNLQAVKTTGEGGAPEGRWIFLPENGGDVRTRTYWTSTDEDSMYFRLHGRETRPLSFTVVWIMKVL